MTAANGKTSRAKPILELPATLGAAADKVFDLREQKRELDAQVKAVEKDIEDLTKHIFTLLDTQDTRKAEGKRASISVNTAINPSTKDWDATARWIINGKRGDKYAFSHLLYKRIAAPAYRELRALGMVIPGQEDFTNRTLSILALNSKV